MAHNILKDGSYIMYGPKVIPNPFADGGGGGSSDFSTAVVTITNNSNDYADIAIPYVNINADNKKIIMVSRDIGGGATHTYTIVVAEGGTLISNFNGIFEVVSGDAELYEQDKCWIFGDCVLNVIPDR